MGGLVIFVVLVAIVAAVGVGFGIVFLAPRLGRALDRQDDNEEGPGD